ncbi:response regulator [Roseateles chitosanitabidus]|uniref:response regulator n=1 Tax=Roseateles chitosanitabidus TaxID=65048 RepID=UPI00082D7A58|nr:response regulator [Roseateles chitosanitabidus]MBO9687288.1 response regulator [Roseateles chitosanitabidus]
MSVVSPHPLAKLHANPLANTQALVIDANATSRSLMTAQLKDLGVGHVRQATRVRDARVILETQPYDIVLCDYYFDGSEMSGQDLLDELRREQLLPYSTVFVMVTGESSYAKVAEAAEAALDAYLVKPYTSAALADRLASARHRKTELKGIFDAIDAREFGHAADLCLERFQRRATYWLYAARIGAELLLRLERHAEARELYEAIIAARTVPWARLGVARTEVASGNLAAARRTLETLIGDMPEQADSYDLMGRVQMEQGEIGAALATYRTASTLTPGCLLRQQHCGTLAFYAGQRDEAIRMLERSLAQGLRSKLFDWHSLALLALMRFDTKDGKGLKYAADALQWGIERSPRDARLRRFDVLLNGLRLLMERRLADALELARRFARQIDAEDFDLESASLLIALWVRMARQDIELPEMETLMSQLGMRFCSSKSATEVMASMAEGHEPSTLLLREAQSRVFAISEAGLRQAMRGDAQAGVQLLVEQGTQTMNAKLIDMAALVLRRYRDRMSDPDALAPRIEALQRRYVQASGQGLKAARAAGGVALRG